MKHIKLFEGHDKSYWRISHDEYKKDMGYTSESIIHFPTLRNRSEEFTTKEIDYFKTEYPNSIIDYQLGFNKEVGIRSTIIFKPELSSVVVSIITKFKDEWYYVRKNDICYKCDQFDGLINLLEA